MSEDREKDAPQDPAEPPASEAEGGAPADPVVDSPFGQRRGRERDAGAAGDGMGGEAGGEAGDAADPFEGAGDADGIDGNGDGGDARTGTVLVRAGETAPANLFLLPHDTAVVFPDLVAPLVLKGAMAQRAVEQASAQAPFVGCVLVKPGRDVQEPGEDDVHAIGCVARILRVVKMPDGTPSAVLRGVKRFRIKRFLRVRPSLIARVEYEEETGLDADEAKAMARVLRQQLRKVLEQDENLPEEFKMAAANIEAPRSLADFAAAYFVRDPQDRQELLAAFDLRVRLETLLTRITREVELMELGQRIQSQIRERLEKQQRDFFLREQLKEIQKELGQAKDDKTVAIEKIEEKRRGRELPEAAAKRFDEELDRLRSLPVEAPEAGVIRSYLEWILGLPWDTVTQDRADLDEAERILREGHWGLQEAKDRILEFLAVRKLKPDHRGPILCFVGPPGVGKTSLGRSIAECLGRKFVRISLGGLRDEAEIRGHRRTYIGALPGRILQGLKNAGSANPVFVLDELDKVGSDFRGDPASALLEVLDPEQNNAFSDHYLELPFDLSRVLFVATANTLATVPPPLIDRLEVIDVAGYTGREKLEIALRYLLPRQIRRHGLPPRAVTFTRAALLELIHSYTREAGVRNLEQMLARACRKVATRVARNGTTKVKIDRGDLKEYLGVPRFEDDVALKPDRPGIAVGLAWTPVGGQALSIEALVTAGGAGRLTITGMLGNVMMESARIALSHVASLCERSRIECPDLNRVDIHLHVPAGAVPKDGPSAGVTLATALVSVFTKRAIRPRVAMTGELTLTGKVLPVGGIRDKVLAARRAGMREVILPALNEPQVGELNAEATEGLTFHFVSDFRQVLDLVLPDASSAARSRPRRQSFAEAPSEAPMEDRPRGKGGRGGAGGKRKSDGKARAAGAEKRRPAANAAPPPRSTPVAKASKAKKASKPARGARKA